MNTIQYIYIFIFFIFFWFYKIIFYFIEYIKHYYTIDIILYFYFIAFISIMIQKMNPKKKMNPKSITFFINEYYFNWNFLFWFLGFIFYFRVHFLF